MKTISGLQRTREAPMRWRTAARLSRTPADSANWRCWRADRPSRMSNDSGIAFCRCGHQHLLHMGMDIEVQPPTPRLRTAPNHITACIDVDGARMDEHSPLCADWQDHEVFQEGSTWAYRPFSPNDRASITRQSVGSGAGRSPPLRWINLIGRMDFFSTHGSGRKLADEAVAVSRTHRLLAKGN